MTTLLSFVISYNYMYAHGLHLYKKRSLLCILSHFAFHSFFYCSVIVVWPTSKRRNAIAFTNAVVSLRL